MRLSHKTPNTWHKLWRQHEYVCRDDSVNANDMNEMLFPCSPSIPSTKLICFFCDQKKKYSTRIQIYSIQFIYEIYNDILLIITFFCVPFSMRRKRIIVKLVKWQHRLHQFQKNVIQLRWSKSCEATDERQKIRQRKVMGEREWIRAMMGKREGIKIENTHWSVLRSCKSQRKWCTLKILNVFAFIFAKAFVEHEMVLGKNTGRPWNEHKR